MGKKLLFVSILLCGMGCNTYKPLPKGGNNFEVGQKYTIRIGNRPLERVMVNAVTDSTLVVQKGRTELVVQRKMITESRSRKVALGKTTLGVAVGGVVAYAVIGILTLW